MRKWFKEKLRKVLEPFFSSRNSSLDHVTLIRIFLNLPEHKWILTNKSARHALIELFSELPSDILCVLLIERKLLLHFCTDRLSANFFQNPNRNIVLIFPDLLRLLSSARRDLAKAVLLHELGHVFHNHAEKMMSIREAQIQADQFAWEMGYGMELMEILADQLPSFEVPSRIENLIRLTTH